MTELYAHCNGCSRFLNITKFMSVNKDGRRGRRVLCVDCVNKGVTLKQVKLQSEKKICPACQKERTLFDFMGSKFNGDPYQKKTGICWHCRYSFKNKTDNFYKITEPLICPFCEEEKGAHNFSGSISGFEKVARGYIPIDTTRACLDCRLSSSFNEFVKYLKRVSIKESKKKSITKDKEE